MENPQISETYFQLQYCLAKHLFAMKGTKPFVKDGCNLCFPEDASFILKSGVLMDALLKNSLASETSQK